MGYCSRCGAPAADGARFCSACGAGLASSSPAPARDVSIAGSLILAGVVLGIALPILTLTGLTALAAIFDFDMRMGPWLDMDFRFGVPMFVAAIAAFFVLVVTVVWVSVSLHARRLIQRGELERGGIEAMIAGGVMLVLGMGMLVLPAIAGGLVLAGGAVAYARRGT